MESVPLSIHLLGAFEVRLRGAAMRSGRTRSVEWLLALLVLRQGREVSRSWLAGTFWPESSEAQALFNLRRNLMDLRRALGLEAERLRTIRGNLLLDLRGATVDVFDFDAAIAAGDEDSLQCAVTLYRGPLLEGCVEEWAFGERASRAEACLQALETLADRAAERGDPAAALGHLLRAEALDPLRDSVQQRRMRMLAASGDHPAALLSYRDHRLRLHREMNLEPDPETTRLFRELQAGRRTRGRGEPAQPEAAPISISATPPVAPSSPRPIPAPRLPRPLTHLIGREQELSEAIRLVSSARLVTLVGGGGVGKTRLALQVAAGLGEQYPERAAFVELAPLADPTLLPGFVAAALGLHEAGAGAGGAEGGGTHEVGRWGPGPGRLDPQGQGRGPGPGRLDAEGVSAGRVPAERVAAPGMPEPHDLLQALIGWLSQQPALLVLDNCEHLIEAAAELAQTLLRACPELRILTTSRQRLGLTGEIAWRVPSLPAPDPEHLPVDAPGAVEHVLQFPAAQLFVERAARARPGFRLRGCAEALAVARICQRLDGIPLALELAAARVTVLTVAQIAARLDDRFQLLTGGSRAALARHQTLRALIDWSYDSLRQEEAALLRRLSVFAGGWTLEAAEAIANDFGFASLDFGLGAEPETIRNPKSKIQNPAVLDVLAALEDRSLILVDEAGEARFDAEGVSAGGRAPGEGLRYRMLETMREYAREKLRECGEEAAVRTAHAAYLLKLAETAEAGIRGPEQLPWLNVLAAEHGNLRGALAWCLEAPSGGEVGQRLAAALVPFWDLRGDLSEGREALSAVLDLPGAPLDRSRARVLVGAGRLARVQGNWSAAHTFWAEALSIWRQLGDRSGVAEGLEGLADMEKEEYNFTAAASLLQESLTIWRDLGDREGAARSLRLMAQIAEQQGFFPAARAGFEEALGLHRELGNRRAQAADLLAMGKLMVDQGDCPTARTALEECLAIQREAADRWGISDALFYLGRAAQALGDYETARRHWEETLALDREKMGRGGYVVLCLARLADAEGDRAAARAQYEQFIRQEHEVGSRSGVPSGLVALAELDLQEGDEARAATRYQGSLALFEKVGDQEGALACLYALWAIDRHRGDHSGARAWHAQLLATHRKISKRSLLVWSLNHLGVIARQDGDYQAAQAFHEQSLTIGRELAYHKGIAACLESLAGLSIAQQQPDRAAYLGGMAEALRAMVGHLRRPVDQADLQATIAAARTALGPEAFAAAWAEGRAMTLDRAVEFASEGGTV